MRINYRTCHQIRTQSDRLLGPTVTDVDGNSEDRNDTVSVFNGPPPTILTLKSEAEEINAVGTWMTERAMSGVTSHEFGVFVRSEKQMDRARAAVKASGMPFKVLDEHVETISGHVSISTMHLAKGLEFRAVVVMACDDEIVPLQDRIQNVGDDADLQEVYETERHLLYVACTRARDHLLVTSVALLQELGVEVVTRLHQHRTADFRRGRRLGADDHLVAWPKPQRPDWLDQETYDRLPDTLTVREMKFAVRERGFRTQSIVVVTTLRDATTITREDLADLFRQRWHAELDLRNLKSTMSLGVLRCKTPEMVRTELWMGLLAYNLVRHSLLQAAHAAECSPRQLSFCAALQFLANTWLLAAVSCDDARPLIKLRMTHLTSHRVGHRPNRIEPLAIKRRPTPHDWLTKPRATARAELLAVTSTTTSGSAIRVRNVPDTLSSRG